MTRILLPVDFYDASAGAARQGAALARRFHSEIVLLHVLTSLNYKLGALETGYFVDFAGPAREQLQSFLEAELSDLPARRVLLEGEPARRIVEFAHEEDASLIVMPTHGYGLFRRFLLGSVTAKVLHDAECPVWTGVHLETPLADGAISIRRVLCAVDLSPHSRKTLCWAAQLAAAFDAPLALVHATPPVEVTARAGSYFAGEWRSILIQHATGQVEQLQQSLGTQAEVHIESGETAKVVRRAAEQTKADVLVIGRSPSGGMAGRLRTNAYALIRESPCPVVSV